IEEFVEDPDLNNTASKAIIYLGAGACLYFAYFSNRQVRFGLGVAAVIVAATIATDTGNTLYEDRSFFGVYQVTGEAEGAGHHVLTVGDTNHGAQVLGTTPPMPITYYHRTGPIGQLFEALPEEVTSRPAVIGLGTGTMACYNRPGQQLDFYEIDPLIERVARNENLFTYLRDCPGEFNVNLGDARLTLGEVPDGSYGVIVGDAFSSDAIPVHLITREAVDLYFSKLQSDGVVALHISNRHLELEPVLGNVAQDAGLACRAQLDANIADAPGKFVSHWVLMARQEDDLAGIAEDERWMPCETAPSQSVWTDDYSNLLSTFTWD
ncbi:MAG: fused MFS/spermidine synthase, partial [Actinomycetota bacterium]|nr:fused MFS/spermidine synthase [Actinomycetota bacterium]